MDPDELLKQLLANCEKMRKLDEIPLGGFTNEELKDRICASEDLGVEIADQVENLHEWISRGGFVPKAWAREESGLGK